MSQELYTDGIGNIHLTGGMVRLDLVSLQPSEDGKNVAPEKIQRVVMSPDAFIQTFGVMQQFTNKLVEAGLLKKNEPAKTS